jgi:hypothetical protein
MPSGRGRRRTGKRFDKGAKAALNNARERKVRV